MGASIPSVSGAQQVGKSYQDGVSHRQAGDASAQYLVLAKSRRTDGEESMSPLFPPMGTQKAEPNRAGLEVKLLIQENPHVSERKKEKTQELNERNRGGQRTLVLESHIHMSL